MGGAVAACLLVSSPPSLTSVRRLSSPLSIHPLPPLYTLIYLFIYFLCCVHPDSSFCGFSPSLPLLWRIPCLYASRFHPSPSFLHSPCLCSVEKERDRRRVDIVCEVILVPERKTEWKAEKRGEREREREMLLQQLCIRSLSLLLLTW